MALSSVADIKGTRDARLLTDRQAEDVFEALIAADQAQTNGGTQTRYKAGITMTESELAQFEATAAGKGWTTERVQITDHHGDGSYLTGAVVIRM